MAVGPLVAALGFVLMTRAGEPFDFWTQLLPGVVVFGLGLTITVSPLTAAILAAVDTGQSGIGAGMPGSGGIRLKYSQPLALDDVAVDFPNMPIIMAHPSFPWQDEALAVAVRHNHVYIDLSGWSPKYFPANLVQYANTMLADKVLFGSDFPLLPPDRWLADFANLPIREHVRPKILKDNAIKLLGL
jgi:predicted TIM-barrel fold metal-dependent hydrolase